MLLPEASVVIGCKTLQVSDGNGFIQFLAATDVLAGMSAHAPEHSRKRSLLSDHGNRFGIPSLGDIAEVAWNVDPGGTSMLAWHEGFFAFRPCSPFVISVAECSSRAYFNTRTAEPTIGFGERTLESGGYECLLATVYEG